MPRPYVFAADTEMRNAGTGEVRVFMAGETDPGDAWINPNDTTAAELIDEAKDSADLKAAKLRIEFLERQIGSREHDNANLAMKAEAALALVHGLEQDKIQAEIDRDNAMEEARNMSAQLTQAVEYGRSLHERMVAESKAVDVAFVHPDEAEQPGVADPDKPQRGRPRKVLAEAA